MAFDRISNVRIRRKGIFFLELVGFGLVHIYTNEISGIGFQIWLRKITGMSDIFIISNPYTP